MNIKLFFTYLPWIRLPEARLELEGMSEKYRSWQLLDSTPIKRDTPLDLKDAPESIRELYSDFDLKNITLLGGTFFWSMPKQLEQGWGFADMSEVNLVVTSSGKIGAFAAHPIRGMPGGTDCLGVIAKDLGCYLEALLYAQINISHSIRGTATENPLSHEKRVLVARYCSLIAGGYEYYPFWSSLLDLPSAEDIPKYL